jgi:hypothetical protein
VRVGIVTDFTEIEFAAIGRLVWSFTVLEHEFARAAMKLRYDVASPDGPPIDPQITKILKENLNGRFKCFISALKASGEPDEFVEWISEAELKFKDGLRWRDRVCHGNWKRHEDGRLMVRFWDRESLEGEQDVQFVVLSTDELAQLTQTTLEWAIEVADIAGTIFEATP